MPGNLPWSSAGGVRTAWLPAGTRHEYQIWPRKSSSETACWLAGHVVGAKTANSNQVLIGASGAGV